MNSKEPNQVSAVNKTIKIFEVLAENEALTLTELSKKIGENKSTVYRFVCTLIDLSYIKKDENDNLSLTLKLFQLGMCVYSRFDIVKYSTPSLKRLAQLSGETIHLAIDNDGQIVYLNKIESKHSLRVSMQSKVGYFAPEYCTGIGKVLLTWFSTKKREAYLEKCNFSPFTKKTIRNRLDLETELKKIKINKFAIDDEEHEEGVRCLAAPIFGFDGNVIAAVSISGPSIRMTDERLENLVPALLNCTKDISTLIGKK